MTARERVYQEFPFAEPKIVTSSPNRADIGKWHIWSDDQILNGEALFDTQEQAWEDAAWRLL